MLPSITSVHTKVLCGAELVKSPFVVLCGGVSRRYRGAVAVEQGGAQSLSARVRADLVERIRAGEFPVGARVPSLRSLAAHYDVAELTVHAAVKELQHSGVLESASGRGTFVRALPGDAPEDLRAVVARLADEVAELRQRVAAIEGE